MTSDVLSITSVSYTHLGPYAELYGGDIIVLVGSPAAAEAAHHLVSAKE